MSFWKKIHPPKSPKLNTSRLSSGINLFQRIFLRSGIRYFDLTKKYFSAWVQVLKVEDLIENEVEDYKNSLNCSLGSPLAQKSHHSKSGSAHKAFIFDIRTSCLSNILQNEREKHFSQSKLFDRWKDLSQNKSPKAKVKEPKQNNYLFHIKKMALKGLSFIVRKKFNEFIQEIHRKAEYDFTKERMRLKLQSSFHITRKHLLQYFNRLKPEIFEEVTEVIEEVEIIKTTKNSQGETSEVIEKYSTNPKATIQNLRHIMKKVTNSAFQKWKMNIAKQSDPNRRKYLACLLRNLNYVSSRKLRDAFEIWRGEYIEEEFVTTTVVRRGDREKRGSREITLNSHQFVKNALRNLAHILRHSMFRAWTKWNEPEIEEFEEVTIVTKKLIDRHFKSFSVLNKPFCSLELHSSDLKLDNVEDRLSNDMKTLSETQQEKLDKLVYYIKEVSERRRALTDRMMMRWMEKSNSNAVQKRKLEFLLSTMSYKGFALQHGFNVLLLNAKVKSKS